MSAGKVIMMLFASVLVGLVVVGGCVWSGYNKAVGLDEKVSGLWSEVENQLQRRFDLVPNLVETVKGVAGQEKEIFLGIAKSREAYFQAKGIAQKAKAASGFESALSRLLVLKETYPELKSNQSFMKLQDSLEGSENRLAVARKRFNEGVKQLNTFTRQLGGRMFASLAGVEAVEYFEVAEEAKATPKVDFSGGAAAEPAAEPASSPAN